MDFANILQTLWRQKVVVGAVLLIGAVAFAWSVTKGRKYSATSTILAVSAQSGNSAVLDPQQDPTHSAISPADLPSILQSSMVLKRVAADLHLKGDEATKLGSKIKAKTSLASDVIPITVTDSDQSRTVKEANAVARELQRYEQQIAMSRYDLLIRDLQNQLASRRAALHEIDGRIATLSADDPYITADQGTGAINARLIGLEQQRETVRTTMMGDASAAAVAAQRPGVAREVASREIVQNDPVFQNLRNQLGKDLSQLNLEKAGYTDKFDGLSGLQDEVSRETASLNQATAKETADPRKSATYVSTLLDKNKADAAFASDRAQLTSLDRQIADMSQHLASSRGEGLSIAALRRDRAAGDQAYAQLSDRLAVAIADRSQAGAINSIVLLDDATGAAPTLLSRPPVLATALGIVFLWLAITLAFVADGSDKRLRTRTTIEELYGSPVLTSVG
jgi:capsular polysaccharide biosynthesis protein